MGAPPSERKKGLSPVKCSQTNVDDFEGQFYLQKKVGLCMVYVVRQTNKTLTSGDVTTISSMELLLQRPPQIVAMRKGDRFLHPVIATFLSCLTSFR